MSTGAKKTFLGEVRFDLELMRINVDASHYRMATVLGNLDAVIKVFDRNWTHKHLDRDIERIIEIVEDIQKEIIEARNYVYKLDKKLLLRVLKKGLNCLKILHFLKTLV